MEICTTFAHWQIKTDAGSHLEKHVVIADSAWSAELLRPLGIKIPLEAQRGSHGSFKKPGLALTHTIMDTDNAVIANSMEEGLRIAGTAEFAGLHAPANKARAENLLKHARNMLPGLQTETHEWWMGRRPSLPDGLPVIGEFVEHKGLFAAFGHSHYGLMMAPKTSVFLGI